MPKAGIHTLTARRLRNHYRNYLRQYLFRLQRKLFSDKADQGGGFFDAYPRFYETSTIGPRNRINKRYRALIEPNREIIRSKSVLDIASHDGRWSFAAHEAGARHVLGIEAREHLVKNSQDNMRAYQVPEDQVEFVLGDVFQKLDQLEPGRFETVFCLGFFYHTMHHMLLLNKIARLRPTHIILDTSIDGDPDCIMGLQSEPISLEGSGAVADAGDPERILVGWPTKTALELMLASAGFPSVKYYDWRGAGIRRWEELVDYYQGLRVSLVAAHKSALEGSELPANEAGSIAV
jgi:2-polyprenyl-3-methyl-5-hydroxy-6-metoxy-1,4-benzoquinol methylase